MHYILGLDRLENPILVHASLKSDAFSIKLPAAPSNFLFHAHCMSSPSASLEFAAQITADHMLAAFMTMCQILRSFAASSTLFPDPFAVLYVLSRHAFSSIPWFCCAFWFYNLLIIP
jgi:hypothetical protein